jgi:hypothetical protein
MAKLINKGKGESGKGLNNKIVAIVAHPELKIAKSLTFWAVAAFEGEIEIADALLIKLIANLEEKENERGKFLVWNGKF